MPCRRGCGSPLPWSSPFHAGRCRRCREGLETRHRPHREPAATGYPIELYSQPLARPAAVSDAIRIADLVLGIKRTVLPPIAAAVEGVHGAGA